MKLRFKFRPLAVRGKPAKRAVTITVCVPGRHVLMADRNGRRFLRDVSPEFIAAFEARHTAEVLQIRRPYRRA